MTRYVYDQITRRGWKSGPCAVCGKAAKRSRKFSNTINPFNRNEDGTIRTAAEVSANVERLCREWEALPVLHEKCEGGAA